MVRTLWTCQLSSLYERLCRAADSSGTYENRPAELFPGAAAGKCLFALTRQPLPRLGQPEAATPGSGTRVASAPGVWSCIQGKPLPIRGAIVFPAHSGARGPGGGAGAEAGTSGAAGRGFPAERAVAFVRSAGFESGLQSRRHLPYQVIRHGCGIHVARTT
jgi:hypothetical protein